MFAVGRNEHLWDKKWSQVDKTSLSEFLEDVNLHDDRISLLEQWVTRKNIEMDKRFKLPTEFDLLSDKTIYSRMEEKFEDGREKLMVRIF
jgi:hypothetical protein